MDEPQLIRTREQLQFVRSLLTGTLDSDNPIISRERVTLAIERIALIEELLSDFSQALNRAGRQNEEFQQARTIELAVEKEKLQRREVENRLSTPSDSSVRVERQLFPDQGVLDSYSDLARKYGELRRTTQLMRGDVESTIRNVDDFWTGDDDAKKIVIEKLRAAVR